MAPSHDCGVYFDKGNACEHKGNAKGQSRYNSSAQARMRTEPP